MILVDTSVWIDFLNNRNTRESNLLIRSLEQEESIAFTGLILQELLQGCSSEKECLLIEVHFKLFIEIFPQRSTYLLAAKLFRDCKKRGFTIRSSVDCLIAACAIEQECPLLHKDRDYSHIQKISELQIYQ